MVATSDTGSFNVNYGANTFPIHVTAEDGGQKTYTVTIQRGIYTIAFTGEGINSIATQNRNYGTVVTKPATPYRYGYTFEGWYNGEAEYDFDTPVTDNLTLTAKWKPIITFDWFSSKTYGDAPFTLTATSPSPMPIVYTSSNESVATISGNTVTITGAGQTDITANQAGNTNYNAAIPVTYTLFVNSNGSAITFGELPAKTYGDAPFELSASSTAAEPITFISSDENVASISGTTVTIHKANNVQITATQAGGAATFTRTLKINKATLTITANDTSMIYGDPIPSSFTCQYTGFVNGDTESVLTTPPTIYCYAYSWSNVGDYDIEPYGANAGNYSFVYQKGKVTVNKANQVIAWENDTTVTYGEVSYLNLPYYYTDKWNYITYTSDNEDVASISGGYVHIQKAGTAHITATQAGDENYNAATPITHTVTVNKANQVIVWDDEIPTFTYGEVSYLNLPYYTDKWNNITYTSDNEDVATAGNYVYLHNAGTAHITATQAGDDNYNAAAPVSRTLVIEKAPLTVTAENKTRRQGEANPGFTLSYNGFKNNETESVLDVLPSITCAANANSPVGFYAIVLSGGSDNNYAYNLVNGRLEVMATTDINNIENKSISIYPNPAKQYLYIQSESPVQKIEIYDQIGKLVHIESNIAERIDISSLSEGLYLVRIYGNDWVNTQKIMVVR
ncbi:hypothetical protein FACS1894162_4850 [Bacteroidia bacterium]|nr:hypothetical protein FACS1894162_4850 [Bacteroidia bacterium]